MADRLAEAWQQKRFDDLKLAAAPRFLGLLRKSLSPQVAQLVSESLDKDLVHLGNQDIARRVLPAQVQTQGQAQ